MANASKYRVLAFGKLKTEGLRTSADYYLKLIQHLKKFNSTISFSELELKSLPVPNKSEATREKIQHQEAELLINVFQTGRKIVLLDETGKNLTTQEWTDWLKREERSETKGIDFCIGSSLGFSKEIREKAALTLSLGKQTLPHELARVVLLEQLYRSLSYGLGLPYHIEGS